MDVLLWLLPPVVVTVVAMAWIGWLGREGRGEISREEAVRRMGTALERDPRELAAPPRRDRERSTGVAVRRTPRRLTQPLPTAEADGDGAVAAADTERRAS